MNRTDKINFLKAISGGKLNPNDYADLPRREFLPLTQQQGIKIETDSVTINLYTKYKDVETGEIFTDVEVQKIAKSYAACMVLNALYLAEATTFGVGIGKVTLSALTRAEQLQMAFFIQKHG